MKYKEIPMIQGIIKDFHPRMIPEDKAADGLNIMFSEGKIKSRWQYIQFGSQLNGAVSAIINYELLSTRTKYLVVITTRDSYKYNSSTGAFEFITKNYNSSDDTTTATTSGSGDRTVTISDTVLNTAWTESVYEIGFGTNDMNAVTTWYSVSSIDSTDVLTLAEDGPSETAVDYVLRLCWSGDEDNPHSAALPYNDVDEDKIIIVANGIDAPQRWNGTGAFEDIGTHTIVGDTNTSTTVDNLSSTASLFVGQSITGTDIDTDTTVAAIVDSSTITLSKAATGTTADVTFTFTSVPRVGKYVGYFGSVGYEHMMLANLYDGGTYFPQTIEFSLAGQTESWPSTYYDLIDTNDEIMGLASLQTRLIIYKKFSITECWADPAGGNADPFNFNQNKIRNIGTPSIRTVVNYGKFHIFMGHDNIYMFDGINVTPIGDALINSLISELNKEYGHRCFAFPIRSENLYLLFIPTADETADEVFCDKTYVYNYREKAWSIWEMGKEMTASGNYFKEEARTWEDIIDVDITKTGCTTAAASAVIDMSGADNDVQSLTVGMQVIGVGVGRGSVGHLIQSIDDTGGSETITLTGNCNATGTVSLRFVEGDTWGDYEGRWSDLFIYETSSRFLLGDKDGYMWELTPETTSEAVILLGGYNESLTMITATNQIDQDIYAIQVGMSVIAVYEYAGYSEETVFNTNNAEYVFSDITVAAVDFGQFGALEYVEITFSESLGVPDGTAGYFFFNWGEVPQYTFTTRDYPINDSVREAKILQLIIGFARQSFGAIGARCSVDFGRTWSDWVFSEMDYGYGENELGYTEDFMEYILNFTQRGKQVRFQFEVLYGAPFEIEGITIGYNDSGIKK